METNKKGEVPVGLLQELFEKISGIDKKLDLHLQEVRYELKSIREQDEEQNKLLAEHAKRSDQLEKDNILREQAIRSDLQKIEKRVDKLSIPWKIAQYLQIFASWLGGIAFAGVTIIELLKLFKK